MGHDSVKVEKQGHKSSTAKPNKWLENLTLTVLGIAFTLMAIECGVRLIVTTLTPNLMVPDAELGWKHRANVQRIYYTEGVAARVQTNELGLRGVVYVGPSAHKRVLILGDSFADGLEVSNNELFSIILDRNLGPSVEVVNAGIGGYGTVQEILLLRRLEPIVQPDIVVLMAYWNDLTDNVMPFSAGIGPRPYIGQDGHSRPLSWELFDPLLLPVPGAAWLHRNSLAAYLLRNRLWTQLYANQTRPYIMGLRRSVPDVVKWRLYETLVKTLAQNRELILLALPTREDVKSNRWEFTRRLQALASRLDVKFVNLQTILRPEHFYKIDVHWNSSGHRVVAAHLSTIIH